MIDDAKLPQRQSADRRSGLSKDVFIQEYVLPGRPVVLEGETRDWPALKKWNSDFFRKEHGEVEVTVVRTGDKNDRKRMRLAAYLDYLANVVDERPYYLASWVFEKDCPSLVNDYTNPPLFDRWEKHLPANLRPDWRWLFWGPKGSGSPLHVDTFYTSAGMRRLREKNAGCSLAPAKPPF